MSIRMRHSALLGALLALLAFPGIAAAHEVREVGEFSLTVGFMDEPVFTDQKSGLEFRVTRGEEPVEGLESSLQAEVIYSGQSRELPISPRFGQPGWYQSVFFPTAAGPYTFHISGTIDGQEIDESFTAGPDTFGEVQDATSGQFPVAFPGTGDIARDAEAGAAAATTATIALVLGAGGLLAGLVAMGLTLSRRRA
jgi:hypothetical protein